MPLFHAQGSLMQTHSTLIAGASAVLVKRFSATNWIDDIRKYECTVTNSLGVMNDFILRQPSKPTDIDNKLRMMSALPVTEDTLAALRERFGIPKFNALFGMTEVNIPVWRPLDAPDEAGCSGKVWEEFFEVIIADPDSDEALPIGSVGEILVRPKEPFCFMQGYNGMPDRTVETWRNFWFHTGDAGRMDERGFVWYIDRIKDTIRRRGENISSYEVEVLACLTLKPGVAPPKPEDVLDFCVPRMPYFAVPRYIEYLDDIPKTPTQKIQKNKLRERGLSAATWDREAAGYKVRR
jgi:crotonobetaine/carnitine-CoA ligase